MDGNSGHILLCIWHAPDANPVLRALLPLCLYGGSKEIGDRDCALYNARLVCRTNEDDSFGSAFVYKPTVDVRFIAPRVDITTQLRREFFGKVGKPLTTLAKFILNFANLLEAARACFRQSPSVLKISDKTVI